MVEKEEEYTQDVLTIERPALQTTIAEAVDEPTKRLEGQQEFLYADNQTGNVFGSHLV